MPTRPFSGPTYAIKGTLGLHPPAEGSRPYLISYSLSLGMATILFLLFSGFASPPDALNENNDHCKYASNKKENPCLITKDSRIR